VAVLDGTFAFQPGGLDRAAQLREGDSARRDAAALTYVFWRGKLLVGGGARPVLVRLDHPAFGDTREAPLFLGVTPGGPRFAADLALWQPHEDAASVGQFTDASLQVHPGFADAYFEEIRGLMPTLSVLEGECIATARALIGWHGTHRFCSNCGAPSVVELSGWQRKCPACGTPHFPRTDPVVIMAITRGDKLLLGRGASWPDRMYSLLAGFVEPGETIEAAVRRETLEEASIRVAAVGYVASQPWPFPMSLMFGCIGVALDEAISIDPLELVDARWVTRSDVQAILGGTHPDISAPRRGAIAGALIAEWAAGRLADPA
jgi:NAD+ diphosphatase